MEEKRMTDVTEFVNFKANKMNYRVEGVETGDFITYDESKCTGCGDCAMVCAVSLWTVPEGGKARLSDKYKERCMECAGCYAVCEADAIDFRYPDGGSGLIILHG